MMSFRSVRSARSIVRPFSDRLRPHGTSYTSFRSRTSRAHSFPVSVQANPPRLCRSVLQSVQTNPIIPRCRCCMVSRGSRARLKLLKPLHRLIPVFSAEFGSRLVGAAYAGSLLGAEEQTKVLRRELYASHAPWFSAFHTGHRRCDRGGNTAGTAAFTA